MVFFAVAFLVVVVGMFSGGLRLLFKLSKQWRYHATVQTWVVAFVLEIIGLVFVNEQYVPLLRLTIHNGLYYMLALTIELQETLAEWGRGQGLDIVLVLLLPVLPALFGFWYDRRRGRAAVLNTDVFRSGKR